jgi:hypothetical protein
MRDKKRVVTEEANMGVKNVINDQHKTAKVKTFFPPKRLEQLPPMIFNLNNKIIASWHRIF